MLPRNCHTPCERHRAPSLCSPSLLRAAAFTALVALAGCQAVRLPQTHAESAASSAAGLAEPIQFRVEGMPTDEADDPATLTRAEAVRLAVTTDPGVQAALARVRIALADSRQARLLPNPILNLALRIPENGGSLAVEASISQDIISIIRIPRKTSAADHRLRQSAAAAITTTIDLVADVQESYASAQSLEQLLPLLNERKALLDNLLKLARARLAAGEGIRDDVTTIDAQRLELDVIIAEAAQQLRDHRLRLARLTGHPSSVATWTLDPWSPPQGTDAPESAWLDTAMASRPEIQEQAWYLAALGDDLALARLLPFDGTRAGLQAYQAGDWQVGPEVSLPIPIFDTGQARVQRVTAEQIEARHVLVGVKRQVVEDVRRAFESLARSRDTARRIREGLIPLQEQRRVQAKARYDAGHADITALYLAENDMRAALAKATELELKAAIAAIQLERAVGGPGPATRVSVAIPNGTTNP